MSSIERIVKILSPPEGAIEAGTNDQWQDVENRIGKLPTDYKAFIQRFGTGSIDNFLWILNPFSKNQYLNLLEKGKIIADATKTSRRKCPQYHPYSVFPEPGGILPFGSTDNGDMLFWRTEADDPDKWTIVIADSRAPEYEEFPLSMTDFLANILGRTIRSKIFPDDFPSEHPVFKATAS